MPQLTTSIKHCGRLMLRDMRKTWLELLSGLAYSAP